MMTRRPLPGIAFQTVPPPVADRLPRMDVAAFVGFASSGPVGVPVAVEDEVHFRQIFGEEPVLARDEARGADHRAYLGPAVRSFFRNGGTRCWVVRVAGKTAAANRFLVPGLVQFRGDEARAAALRARSEGAWSDGLAVGAVLERTALQSATWDWEAGPPVLTLSRRSREPLLPGDLLRLAYPGATLYLAVTGARADGSVWRVTGTECWFAPAPALPPLAASGVAVLGTDRRGEHRPLTILRYEPPGDSGGGHRFYLPLAESPGPGSLLEVRQGEMLLALVPVLASEDATPREAGQPDWAGGPLIVLTGRELIAPLTVAEGRKAAVGRGALAAERLTVSLQVRSGEGVLHAVGGLGLAPQHARFMGALPVDQVLLAPGAESAWGDLLEPRFPLAGPETVPERFLPLGLWDEAQPETCAGPLPAEGSVPERNGLGEFDPALFFDPDLAGLDSVTLPAAATHRAEILGEPLAGLHALWPLEEVTLVAVPDALHPGWDPVTHAPVPPLAAPDLTPATGGLQWVAIPGATQYRVQWAHDPAFEGAVKAVAQAATQVARPEPGPCKQILFCRVRAERSGEPGPWSNTERVVIQESDFADCEGFYLAPPTVHGPAPAGDGRYMLRWDAVAGGALYRVQAAASPDFADSADLAMATEPELAVFPGGDGPAFYRVRAELGDQASPWSNTVTFFISRPITVWTLRQPDAGQWEGFMRVQAALVRFARARGDVVAVLSLPRNLRATDLAAYTSQLTGELAGLDEAALSYGAVYHPWTWVREGAAEPRLTPPDGAMTGRIASRAIARGAWVAPANEELVGVVALAPEQGEGARDLYDQEQVNLLRQVSRGFLVQSEETLSHDPDLRPLHVRRLMILLRRLALREGAGLVFEPNGDRFRRMVQRRFERLLTDLYVRGAFAGRSASEGFQVVADNSVNTPESVDQGRLIVELRVAPAKALTFLRVRLMQTQGARPFTEEV